MITVHVIAVVLGLVILPQPSADTALAALTVPAEKLPTGCALAAKDTLQLDGGKVRSGMWAGLPIPANPWTGSDEAIVAAIRERIEPPARVVDGPPLTPRERARFRLGLAEGVEAAYAAFYVEDDQRVIGVYAVKLANAVAITTRVIGADGACRDAILAHTRQVAR